METKDFVTFQEALEVLINHQGMTKNEATSALEKLGEAQGFNPYDDQIPYEAFFQLEGAADVTGKAVQKALTGSTSSAIAPIASKEEVEKSLVTSVNQSLVSRGLAELPAGLIIDMMPERLQAYREALGLIDEVAFETAVLEQDQKMSENLNRYRQANNEGRKNLRQLFNPETRKALVNGLMSRVGITTEEVDAEVEEFNAQCAAEDQAYLESKIVQPKVVTQEEAIAHLRQKMAKLGINV
ncbi:hypothetical protein [Moorena sp. SIO3I8]|uniref:hypothetical protein n=1 Tax=Moorena sp. SIO3I8 TaxID=2607833 RepID=UPI0013C06366|nr:hypothetical protein [Moorena sp. SIO3I8]NEO08753.1 hypothetical protein [Moorena sp. SIO3I8]